MKTADLHKTPHQQSFSDPIPNSLPPPISPIQMSQTFPAYGVTALGLDIKELAIQQRQLGPSELLLQTLYCGVCASDIHQMTGGWAKLGVNIVEGNQHAGLCCGHEAISVVIGLGPDAKGFSLGDVVGCGPQRDTVCNQQRSTPNFVQCEMCEIKQEQLCLNGVTKLYSKTDTGGFASLLMVPDKFCFLIPTGMDLMKTAPLNCAGLTTFAPLQQFTDTWKAQGKTKARVGVIGIGGLGLMALQYAIKMDPITEVFAFTTSKASKEADLLALGCVGVIDYCDATNLTQFKNSFDLIINTVSQKIDIDLFMTLVKPLGELNCLGLGSENLTFNPFSLLANKKVSASFIGGTKAFAEMLNFSHKHNIYPICESVKVPFGTDKAGEVAAAMQRVEEGKVRYRMVLDYCVDVPGIVAKAREAAAATVTDDQ